MSDKSPSEVVASGVEALIERLRGEGVAAGRERAEQIVAEAQQRAREITARAQQEADELLGQARAAERELERAGVEALRAASRDALLELRNTLTQRFGEAVKRMVAASIRKEEVIERMIVEIAGRAGTAAAGSPREILLPRDAVDLEQVRRHPEEHGKGVLAQLVRQTADDLLREGVTLSNARDLRAGLRVRVGDGGVELDLGEEAIAALLLAHLQPRFRALLDGVVR